MKKKNCIIKKEEKNKRKVFLKLFSIWVKILDNEKSKCLEKLIKIFYKFN